MLNLKRLSLRHRSVDDGSDDGIERCPGDYTTCKSFLPYVLLDVGFGLYGEVSNLSIWESTFYFFIKIGTGTRYLDN